MKKSLQTLFIACFLLISANVNAQSGIFLEASQLYTTFNFVDSQGNNLSNEYTGRYTGTYGFGYSYTTDFGLLFRTGIGMRNAGARLDYDDMSYSWDMQYAQAKLGLGYSYYIGQFSPYLMAYGYYGHMLTGTQRLNNEHFDLLKSELLTEMDYGLIVSPGVEIVITENLSSFIELKYIHGFHNIETIESKTTNNRGYGLSVGLSVIF